MVGLSLCGVRNDANKQQHVRGSNDNNRWLRTATELLFAKLYGQFIPSLERSIQLHVNISWPYRVMAVKQVHRHVAWPLGRILSQGYHFPCRMWGAAPPRLYLLLNDYNWFIYMIGQPSSGRSICLGWVPGLPACLKELLFTKVTFCLRDLLWGQ